MPVLLLVNSGIALFYKRATPFLSGEKNRRQSRYRLPVELSCRRSLAGQRCLFLSLFRQRHFFLVLSSASVHAAIYESFPGRLLPEAPFRFLPSQPPVPQ